MASTSSETPSLSSSSSSSSSNLGSNYDVFLSFRGEDTRHSFTDHLYETFRLRGIEAFRDSEKLQLGQEIASELIQAIEKSQYAVVVFSEKYADSRWCLDELAVIVECKKNKGLKVVPVFYHVDPSNVRKQTGPFEKAFDKHQKNDNIDGEKIQKWKDAMREVGNLAGKHIIPHESHEAQVVQKIVQEIFFKLNYRSLSVDLNGLVGINSRAEELKSLLAKKPNKVHIIGIWGMGGMGKTTLARVVYGMISNQFEACSFIRDVRENSEKGKLLELQKKLLEELLMGGDMKIQDVDHGVLTIKKSLCKKKILLILDDVYNSYQLEKLAGKNWFGPGSRVLITTREKSLLETTEVNEIYEIKELNEKDALQLFSLKAFKKDQPDIGYKELSHDFVDYSHGLPLALEILGCSLFGKRKDEWKSLLDKLKKYPNKDISNVLQWSYNGLDENEKEIFLNIACFFNHKNKETIKEILEYLELFPKIGFTVLIDKSIIKVDENHLWMHDLLQEMGRDIVRKQSPIAPGKRSRLWLYEDIDDVLTNNTGTDEVQAMVLELSSTEDVDWHPEAFSKMQYLKLLIIDSVHFKHDLKHLPNNLRFLDWRKYPSKSLPSSFKSTKLVKLCMNCSYIEQLWEGTKYFTKLKFIDLNKSQKLIETPDFSKVPALAKLDLEDCTNLRTVHSSISFLESLIILNLKGCKNLINLPEKFAMKSLDILTFSGCSKLQRIPEFGKNMERVSELYLDGTAITNLPTSIGNLTGLALLTVRDCKNLMSLPHTFFNMKSLENLDLSGCTKLKEQLEKLGMTESVEELDVSGPDTTLMPSRNAVFEFFYLIFRALRLRNFYPMQLVSNSVSGLTSLTKLDLRDCNLNVLPNDICSLSSLKYLDLSGNNFNCLPNSIARLHRLRFLWVEKCKSLRSLPKLPLNIGYINGYGCTSLETVPDDLLEPNSSVERRLYLSNCSNLANNQVFMNMFLAGIRKHYRVPLSVFHSFSVFFPSLRSKHQVFKLPTFPDDVPGNVFLYMPHIYDIIIPGNEIPDWFDLRHQNMGRFVEIKEPSQLGNKLVGIVVCVVFCSRKGTLSCWLEANGKEMSSAPGIHNIDVLSDHTWLLYLHPEFYHEKERESLRECDENGCSQFSISIFGADVKKCGLRMVYERDIEDLNRTMSQSSNNNSTPEGSIVLNDFTVVVKPHNKPLSEGLDEFTLIVESEGITELMTQGLDVVVSNGHLVFATTCPVFEKHKECRHPTSDSQESNEGLLDLFMRRNHHMANASDFCSIQ